MSCRFVQAGRGGMEDPDRILDQSHPRSFPLGSYLHVLTCFLFLHVPTALVEHHFKVAEARSQHARHPARTQKHTKTTLGPLGHFFSTLTYSDLF